MRLRSGITTTVVLCAAALSMTLATSGAALGAGSSVTLKVKGARSISHRQACGKTKQFRIFGRSSTIEFKGILSPHPIRHFPVRIEISRCAGGHWSRIANFQIVGKKATGKYKGFLSARSFAPHSHRRRAIIYYLARAIVTGGLSRKVYFAVTG